MKPTARYFGMIRRSQTRVADLERVIPTRTTKKIGGGAVTLPFLTSRAGGLKVKVLKGRVTWHGIPFDFADDVELTLDASEAKVVVYVSMAEPVPEVGNDGIPSPTPSFEILAKADGWNADDDGADYPDQPSFPAVKFFPLAEVETGTEEEGVKSVTLLWHGGDLKWQGPYSAYA